MVSYSEIPSTLLVLSLLLFLSPLFIHKPYNLVAADEQLISAECRGSTDQPTCLICVKSNPGAREADKTGIASIVVNCINDHGNNMKANFTNLVSKTQDQTLKGVYQGCIGNYSVSKKLLVSAQKALQRHNKEAANTFVGKAYEFSCNYAITMLRCTQIKYHILWFKRLLFLRSYVPMLSESFKGFLDCNGLKI